MKVVNFFPKKKYKKNILFLHLSDYHNFSTAADAKSCYFYERLTLLDTYFLWLYVVPSSVWKKKYQKTLCPLLLPFVSAILMDILSIFSCIFSRGGEEKKTTYPVLLPGRRRRRKQWPNRKLLTNIANPVLKRLITNKYELI